MPPPRVPRELLFGDPEKASPLLSPDGKRLSLLAPDAGVLNIWAGPADAPLEALTPVTRDRGRGIRSYLWAEDGKSLLFVQDKDGDENWHLHQVDADTGQGRDLTPYPGVQAHVVATDPRSPHELLVSMNRRDPRLQDAYRLDLRTGGLALAAENPGEVVGWLADSRLRVRAAKAMRPDGGSELRVRRSAEGPWETLLTWGPDEQGGAHGFTPGDEGLYVESSLGSDTTVLQEVPLDGSPARLLASREGSDLGGVLLHPTRYHAEAAAFEGDRLSWTVLDESLKADFEALSRLEDGDLRIVSRDDADRTWLVLYTCDDKPPRFWRYDRGTRTGRFLFTSRPALEGWTLARMRPVRVRARDGLELPCYLTLPPGAQRSGLPLVLLVHGGPWVRDSWGFHPEAQWLASLGFAVLQVNYRGSQGFGKRFLHAGDREWGAKMQDDLTDAALWAVSQGVADPSRLAIYGGSYGGYAALAGAAFTPDLYRCAVDIVGPSNIETLIRSIPPYWEPLRRVFDLRVGDADKEPEFLKSRSPLFHADKITIPLLIAQGANDPRVKQAESEQIVSALKARGRPVEYLLFPDEGHGFARPENRLRFYEKAEAFLLRHLAPREAAAPGTAAR